MPNVDSARYAISVHALDKNTVELKGLKNGETVRRAETFAGLTCSSDKLGHALHRFAYEPVTCPNEYTSQWFEDFMEANEKTMLPEPGLGLEKRVEIHRKSGKPRHFPFGPLKTDYSLLN